MTTDKPRCSEDVWDGGFRPHRCRNSGSVERDGKWYCKVHDPIARKERQERRDEEYRAEQERQLARRRKREAERRIETIRGATLDEAMEIHAVKERVERLEECLSWMLGNYKLTLARKPVRDVPECFAAAEAVLRGEG
jgi:uncharacterized Zn finger protein (UPF0148 family)